MSRTDVARAVGAGLLAAGLLGVLIVAGSRRLDHFDAALIGYTSATVFAAFGITYRYAMWLQRPPTALYFRRGISLFLRPGRLLRNAALLPRRAFSAFVANAFIFRRGATRGAAHFLIMWGCLLAAAITFPLVFGWLHFEAVEGEIDAYRVIVFGFETVSFPVESLAAGLVFHGLVIASFMVIPGVMLAMRRRMREAGAAAVQQPEDFVALILLFAVSVTGLMLVVSYEWMHGYGYEFLAILHAATVIGTLLYLPFGKLFHVVQRPAQLGIALYKDEAARTESARCTRCGEPFASRMQVEDLIGVERALGYRYETADGKAGHYQFICPDCRRRLVALAQGRLYGWGPPEEH